MNILKEESLKIPISKEALCLESLNLKSSPTTNSAFILRNCLTCVECSELIAKAEKEGFCKVLVNFGGNDVLNESVRSGSRFISDDQQFVSILWERIRQFIPTKLKGAKVVGLNERLRFLRYHPGQKFAPHYDGTFSRPNNCLEVSLLTLQIYLNGDFEGGETTFLGDDDEEGKTSTLEKAVKPETGMILVFEQDLMHEGSELKSGIKYTIRTDVMYSYSPQNL